jgi:hypothetical protein
VRVRAANTGRLPYEPDGQLHAGGEWFQLYHSSWVPSRAAKGKRSA